MALRHWWKLDEANATDVAVDSVGTVDLQPASGAEPAVVADPRFGFARRWGAAGGSNPYLHGFRSGVPSSPGSDGDLVTSLPAYPIDFSLIGTEWSLTWWMRITGGLTASAALFYVGKPDNQACNHTIPHAGGHAHAVRTGHLNVGLNASEHGTWRWTRAPSTQTSGHNGSNSYPTYSVWLHHAIVRRGGNVEVWCGDTLLASMAYADEPYTPQDDSDAGGFAPGPEVFWVGRSQGSNENINNFYYGALFDLAHVRLYDHALTEAEIIDLAAPDPTPDDTAPVISNVSPAAGSTITRQQTWSCRVTDDVGFRRIMLWVLFTDSQGNERGREVVWDGTEFAAAYRTLSSRTEVTAGTVYDFSLRRNGGWPWHPEIYAAAIDTSGNEGT